MAWIAGVDGCKGGWIAVYEDTESGELDCRVAVCERKAEHADHDRSCAFEAVMRHHPPLAAVAVDMPIGLCDDKDGRACDRAARKVLGKRSSSIFSAPAASVLRKMKSEELGKVQSYGRANELNRESTGNRKEQDGKGLSRQSWALVPKIAEVARYLEGHPGQGRRIHEAHPEVCFAALKSGKACSFDPMHHPKTTFGGLVERRELLKGIFGARFGEFEASAAECDAVGRVAPDDFYDALACLWTARRIIRKECRSLPKDAQYDADGLPRRIVY